MSRIGKEPITVPAGVDVRIEGQTVFVKGPKGELQETLLPEVKVKQEGDIITVSRIDDSQTARCRHGLSRTLVANMVEGVASGFEKKLEIIGVGYKAALKGKDLDLALGYSHPVAVKAPEGISFEVPESNQIIVKGFSKQLVGQVAADIRKWRKPEPYKGKGIRYEGEYVRRKLGKQAASASA